MVMYTKYTCLKASEYVLREYGRTQSNVYIDMTAQVELFEANDYGMYRNQVARAGAMVRAQ